MIVDVKTYDCPRHEHLWGTHDAWLATQQMWRLAEKRPDGCSTEPPILRVSECGSDRRTTPNRARDHGDNEQHDEDDEQHFRNSSRRACNAAKAKGTCNQRNDKKSKGPA